MKIIEIKTLNNGAHRNQMGDFGSIPDGWAVIPENMETKNFPFGEIEFKKVDGVMTVTKWTAGVMPEVKEDERPISEIEQLRADIVYLSLMTGVKL